MRKTYKLYIGGAFPRTESGRAYEVFGAKGELLANASRGTRKDVREAVRAARNAFPGWAGKTAYNRSQILYRIAELMEGRRDQFVAEVMAAEGRPARPRRAHGGRRDRPLGLVRRLGRQVPAAARHRQPGRRPVLQLQRAGADRRRRHRRAGGVGLLGLVSRLAPAIVSGNAVVVIASETRPLPAVTLSEVLATSDVPGGVVNLITGLRRELVGHLAGHMDVNGLDAFGAAPDEAATLEEVAVENVKRFVRPPAAGLDTLRLDGRFRTVAVPDRRIRGDQDRLAPDRRLISR